MEKINLYQKKKIKEFTRFLKEIGLYKEWLAQRKDYVIYLRANIHVFRCVWNNEYLSSIINESFEWSRTGKANMWSELYVLSSQHTIKTEAAIGDEIFIKKAKTIVDNYTNY